MCDDLGNKDAALPNGEQEEEKSVNWFTSVPSDKKWDEEQRARHSRNVIKALAAARHRWSFASLGARHFLCRDIFVSPPRPAPH